MEFKTYVSSIKKYDMQSVHAELVSRVTDLSLTLPPPKGLNTDALIEALSKSYSSHFHSRYGLEKEVLFADSELISAYEQGERCVQYLQYRYDFKYYPLNYKLRDFPLVMAIEASSKCNLRCPMCFQEHMDEQSEPQNQGILSYNLYKKFLDELKGHTLYSIVFASRGEPLLNPFIDRMIQDAKEHGVFDIKLNTNGTLLTEDLSRRLLISGLDLIVFSVDSINYNNYHRIRGVSLDSVLNKIEVFLRIKKEEFPNSKLKVRVAMVITNQMSHIAEDEVEKAKQFWLKRVDELSVKSEVDFIHVYDKPNYEIPLSACSLLWERLYLWYDGRVNPCDIDHLSTLCLGDISQNDTISNIWNGSKMESLRQQHLTSRLSVNHVCARCTGY
jgi:radical SAM protein with 4Fe4S-binding SPASM domain